MFTYNNKHMYMLVLVRFIGGFLVIFLPSCTIIWKILLETIHLFRLPSNTSKAIKSKPHILVVYHLSSSVSTTSTNETLMEPDVHLCAYEGEPLSNLCLSCCHLFSKWEHHPSLCIKMMHMAALLKPST
jgi:hypothetical protein